MTLGDVVMWTVFFCGAIAGMMLLASVLMIVALFFGGAK